MEQAAQSIHGPDKEIWREEEGDYYSPSIHITGNGLLGINVGGRVIVRSVREIHRTLSQEIDNGDHSKE